ncbi:NAD(P)H-binding protein [Kribbella swartbergensis]
MYLKAKKAAEDDLKRRDLDWTILRPGSLTNDPGTGQVRLADRTGRGSISRDDVALVLAGLCRTPASIGRTLELVAGDTPVDEALKNL